MSPGNSSAIFCPSSARSSYAMNGEMYARRSACRCIASVTRRSPWPMFTPISWLLKSMKRLPSTPQK